MTLRLVEPAPIELKVWNPRLIPDIARTFADKVEAGEFGPVSRCAVVVETDEGQTTMYWGEDLTQIEAIGLLHVALAQATNDALADD